jgi:small subunit ribosomal protein S13
MTTFIFPGLPIVSGKTPFREATLGVIIRNSENNKQYGLTSFYLFDESEIVNHGRLKNIKIGKYINLIQEHNKGFDYSDATQLIGFIEIEESINILNRHPHSTNSISLTVEPHLTFSKELTVFKRNGNFLKAETKALDKAFDLLSEDGSTKTFISGVEIISNEENYGIEQGDAGAPVVTEDGKLLGIIVATNDTSAIVAPLHYLVQKYKFDFFVKSPVYTNENNISKRNKNNRAAIVAGVTLPSEKIIFVSLQAIMGIGKARAKEICDALGLDTHTRTSTLTHKHIMMIREFIDETYTIEGDLRREIAMNIKRLMDLGCYRGLRHRKGLPVRGQRTHSNARTRKGPVKESIKLRK